MGNNKVDQEKKTKIEKRQRDGVKLEKNREIKHRRNNQAKPKTKQKRERKRERERRKITL